MHKRTSSESKRDSERRHAAQTLPSSTDRGAARTSGIGRVAWGLRKAAGNEAVEESKLG